MIQNELASRRQEIAASFLADLILKLRSDVKRVGVMDVTVEGTLWWKYLLVFVKDPDLVRHYIEVLSYRSLDPDKSIDYGGNASFMLLPWLDSADMVGWLRSKEGLVSEFASQYGDKMSPEELAGSIMMLELIIVPGAGMDVNASILYEADIHQPPNEEVGAVVTKIYNAARDDIAGYNINAIVGRRPGVRFYNRTTKTFEV